MLTKGQQAKSKHEYEKPETHGYKICIRNESTNFHATIFRCQLFLCLRKLVGFNVWAFSLTNSLTNQRWHLFQLTRIMKQNNP